MHVVVEAGTSERVLPLVDLEVAAAQLELIADQLEDPARGAGEERAVEEITLLPVDPPCEDDARIVLGDRDLMYG